MIKVKSKRILAMLMLVLTLFSTINPSVFATEISSANIQNRGDVEYHLQYWNEAKNAWYYITTTYTTYSEGGKEYPAYCVNREHPGVGELDGYTVDVNASVTDVLGDVRIWRTIINGFPYKSASELGVANDLEAFQATKQAVYCILYNFDPVTRFRGANQGADARGDAIKNAIVNMVNIGRNGSQLPSDPNITLSNSGNLYEDGNYYTQKINVSSTVEMTNYTITATANLPQGTIITNSNGIQTNSFNGNESMYVKIPKSQMVQDISNAIINVQGKCKTYPVFYGKTRTEGTQNYALTYDPFGDGVGRATLNIKTNTGKLQINKTDSETSKPIAGVTFQLTKADGTVVANATTNLNGIATFSGLYQGNYKLKEISTNDNYVINKATFDVNVEYNKSTNQNITNDHKKGNLKIYKVDKDNHKIALGNVQFDLYSEEFQRVIGTYTTDVNGEISIKNLRTGSYKLIEKNTGKWYNLAEDTTVEVKWNTTEENTIENELKKGQVKVIKIDLDNKEVKLQGVKFDVLDENGKVLETITTDENGEAYTSRYAIRDYSKLTIREKETLQNYVLNETTQTVVLEAEQIKTVTFTNELKKGQIKVIKVDQDNNEVKLKGVEFKVYDEDKNLVDTLLTDENGEATSKRLRIDKKYTVQESKTLENYVLNEIPQIVTLTQNQITDLTFKNELKKGQIKVIKVDKDNNEVKLKGVEFKVYDEDKNLVDTLITDENGEAISKRLRIDKKYTVQESKTLENYVLNEIPQTVTLTQDQITNLTFENELIKGYIRVIKVSKEDNKYNGDVKGSRLENAKFEVYDENNNLVDTLLTDKNGEATTKELLKGKYTLKEVESPDYYILTDEIFEAEIIKHQEIVDAKVEDDNVDIDIEVTKKGFIETQNKDNIYYDFSNIHNKSNIALDNFTWSDSLPTNALRANKIYTGTWNEDLTYSVWYKTNLSDDYIMLKDGLSTLVNNEVKFTDATLKEGEFITDFQFRFGTVKSDFKEVEKPRLYCDMLDNLPNGFIFVNHTKASGNYKDIYVEDKDDWKTITYLKEIETTQKLPRTGC
jgi:uncharacterized surface anchored protein